MANDTYTQKVIIRAIPGQARDLIATYNSGTGKAVVHALEDPKGVPARRIAADTVRNSGGFIEALERFYFTGINKTYYKSIEGTV